MSRRTAAKTPWYIETPITVGIVLLVVFLVHTFVGRVYQIPSESMEPTLHGCHGCTGDRIAVDEITYRVGDVHPGDVVVFEVPEAWHEPYTSIRSSNPVLRAFETAGSWAGLVPPDENDYVKRVVAVGGQHVGGCSPTGALMVDGHPLDEPYLRGDPAIFRNPANCAFGPVTVPQGSVWVMGDNRNDSKDARFHMGDGNNGAVPLDHVRGKVRAIIWPLGRLGTVDSPDIG